jgi:hypothetical protein
MRVRTLLAAALSAVAPLAAQDHGAWVVRLGVDTVAMETYTRTATELRGELVTRSPISLHRIYTVTYGPSGVTRFQLVAHNIGGVPNVPMETQSSADFTADSIIEDVARPAGRGTVRLAGSPNALPYLFMAAGLLEDGIRVARNRGVDTLVLAGVQLGAAQIVPVSLRIMGQDSVRFMLDGNGPFLGTIDATGRLTHLSGREATDKFEWERVPSLDLGASAHGFASRPIAQLSPRDTVRGSVGGADISIEYGRPSMRGRKVFGGIVSWGQVWRTGANSATRLITTAPLVIGGQSVPAGTYTLFTLPTPTGWKLIINKETLAPCPREGCRQPRGLLSGTDYSADSDLVRLDMRVTQLTKPVEQFTITVTRVTTMTNRGGGLLTLAWENTAASIDLEKK